MSHSAIALPGGTALFTTRRGGVSEGPFGSLNLGLRTDDDPDASRENRARVERLTGGRIAPARQVHGTDVVAADPDAPCATPTARSPPRPASPRSCSSPTACRSRSPRRRAWRCSTPAGAGWPTA